MVLSNKIWSSYVLSKYTFLNNICIKPKGVFTFLYLVFLTHAPFKRNLLICGDSPNWLLYSTITGYFSRPYEQWGEKKKIVSSQSSKILIKLVLDDTFSPTPQKMTMNELPFYENTNTCLQHNFVHIFKILQIFLCFRIIMEEISNSTTCMASLSNY